MRLERAYCGPCGDGLLDGTRTICVHMRSHARACLNPRFHHKSWARLRPQLTDWLGLGHTPRTPTAAGGERGLTGGAGAVLGAHLGLHGAATLCADGERCCGRACLLLDDVRIYDDGLRRVPVRARQRLSRRHRRVPRGHQAASAGARGPFTRCDPHQAQGAYPCPRSIRLLHMSLPRSLASPRSTFQQMQGGATLSWERCRSPTHTA
jgi:hypothetical protein